VLAGVETTTPKPGDLVGGRYRVESVLGSGGMGIVLDAVDEGSGEHVALKLLRNVSNPTAVDRFFREARAMSRLATRHAVRVRGVGSAGDAAPFLVMDRLEGSDLRERVRKSGACAPAEVADWMIQACEALAHAHENGIVHRDLKPSNLFLHRDAGGLVLKVLDFGISKVVDGGEWERTLTSSGEGVLLGSPPYMSPEQARDPSAVDARSDIYSLGVVMYELLSGRLPFGGRTVGEIFASILEKPYPSLLAEGVPETMDAIVALCMAKQRRERYRNVGELARALATFAPARAALAEEPCARLGRASESLTDDRTLTVSHGAPARTDRPPPMRRRGRAFVALASLAILGAAGVLGARGMFRAHAAPAVAPPAPPPPTVAPPPPTVAPAIAPPIAPPPSTSAPPATAPAARPPPPPRPRPAAPPPAASATPLAPSASARSELQPSPYPDP